MSGLREALESGPALLADGAMGTELMREGLEPGACSEIWNTLHPERVERIHECYLAAGCQLLLTNSFGANRLRLALFGEEDRAAALNRSAAELARRVAGDRAWVLGDIGPSGGILAPLGDLDPEQVHSAFREQAEALVGGGADALIVETQTCMDEMRLAVRAARESGAPLVIASFAFDRLEDGSQRTMMGVAPRDAARSAREAGADLVGLNCGSGLGLPDLVEIVAELARASGRRVLAKPNAGTPELHGEAIVYPETPEHMASWVEPLLRAGAGILGGCCGTTPAHMRRFRERLGRL